MDINTYIDSGILELYVAGALSDKEREDVYAMMKKHPEVLDEVLEIEVAIVKLTAATAGPNTQDLYPAIKATIASSSNQIVKEAKVVPLYNWVTYTGWAAALIVGVALFWSLNQNRNMTSNLNNSQVVNAKLEEQIANSKTDLAANKNLLNILRDKNIISIPLNGQGEFANTYAKVYWNKNENSIYLDAQGLPEAPEGKVYQVWSLKLDPLTPTSLGTIDDFSTDANKVFAIANTNNSEAFGITLEPIGGSETPTMEQLYTLGVVTPATS